MRAWEIIVLISIALLALAGSVFLKIAPEGSNEASPQHTTLVVIGETRVRADVADTDTLRRQGLSGRNTLCDTCGMLFVFDTTANYGFWMNDMHFSIDIVWIDEQKNIIGIEKAISPDSYPTLFYPPSVVRYVLEVPAGFSDTYGVTVGSVIDFEL